MGYNSSYETQDSSVRGLYVPTIRWIDTLAFGLIFAFTFYFQRATNHSLSCVLLKKFKSWEEDAHYKILLSFCLYEVATNYGTWSSCRRIMMGLWDHTGKICLTLHMQGCMTHIHCKSGICELLQSKRMHNYMLVVENSMYNLDFWITN